MTYIQYGINFKLLMSENIDNNVWINAIQLTEKYDNTIVCNIYHSPSESDSGFIGTLISRCEEMGEAGQVIVEM